MCDGRSLASPLLRRLAGRGAFFCGFLIRWVLRFVLHFVTVLHFVSGYVAPEKVPLVIVIVHAIPCLAFFSLLYGFVAVKPW